MSRRAIVIGIIVLIIIAGVVGVFVLGGPAATLAIFTGIGDTSEASQPIIAEELTPESAGATVFRIAAEESEVRFLLDEVLFGTPTRVIARSRELAGDVVVDFANPSNSQIGTIRVNARTLETDNEFRNRAIRNNILQTNQFEFAEFTPTSIEGLPDTIEPGEPLEFQVIGDLTVRDITTSVTFNVALTTVSETRLEGTATTQVTRSAYELEIPPAPGVADVSDAVDIEMDFVAVAVGAESAAAEETVEAAG